MVGSNSSETAPRAFSSRPFRLISITSVSVGSVSFRMSHHRTWQGWETLERALFLPGTWVRSLCRVRLD